MKQILTILLFLTIRQNCFATEWAWYYIYIQTDYVQGPWTRTDILDKSGSYKYLHPKQFEELFGSEGIDFANAIINHLQEETPERYKFKSTLSLSSDTVVIQTNETIADFDAVKNELTASYTLNNFIAIKIVQANKTTLYQLKDITIPYMDLVFPGETLVQGGLTKSPGEDTIKNDTLTSHTNVETLTNHEEEKKISIWLVLSVITNLLLIFLLLRRKK